MSRTREINYKVSFTGDSKQALQAIQQLKTELASIGNMSVGKNSSQEMKQMVSSAQQLQTHLNRSFDANGNLNLAKFNNSLKTSNTSLAALSTNLLNGGKAGQKAFADLATAVSQTQRPVSSLHGVVGELWYTFKNTIKWGLASSAFNNLTSSLSKAIGYSKQLNTSLNNIRIVTGESAEAMEKFSIYANNTAKALKTTTTEVSDAALIYYQQGDTESVVKQKTEITTKAANVSPDSDAAQMSEYLTAVWNGYQAVEGEYEDYVDKLAAVGAATASSLEEVATGMTKVASTANTVGVDFDQLNAILSTVGSVTREAPETTGTAFKTIFARMEDLKMGETLEDGVTLGSVSKILDKVNISIFDAEGNLRDLGGILEELMQNWNEWDRSTKVAVAEQLAGKRQYTQLFALLENQDMYYDALKTSQEAEGALQEMQDIYAESWVASNEKLKASIEDVYNDLINSDFAIGFVDTLSTIVNLIDEIVEGVGGAGAVFSGLGAILTKVFSTQIMNSMQQAAYTFSTLTGRAQAQHAQVQKTVGNLAIRSDNVGPTVTMQMQQSQELNQLAEAREKIEKSITAEDARQLDLAINDLKTHQQSTLKEQEELEILQKQTKELKEQRETNINKVGSTLYNNYTTNQKRYQNAQTLKGLIDSKKIQEPITAQGIQDYYKQIQQYNTGRYINNTKFYKDLQSINNELKRTGTLTPKLKEDFKAIFTGRIIGKVQGDLTTLSNETERTILSLEKGRPILKDIYNAEQQIFNNEQKISSEQDKINEKRQIEKKSLRELKREMNGYSTGISGQITSLTSGIFSLVSAVESFKNLGGIWTNEDLSTGEKIFQTITALTSGIMMASMAYNSLKEAKIADIIASSKEIPLALSRIILYDKENKAKLLEAEAREFNATIAAQEAEAEWWNTEKKLENLASSKEVEEQEYEEAASRFYAADAAKIEADAELNESRQNLADALGNKRGVGKGLLSTLGSITKAVGPILLVVAAIWALNKALTQQKTSRENIKTAIDEYTAAKDEVESLKNELTGVQEKIEELQNKGPLTLTEEEELTKLKKQNAELERQIRLKEILAQEELKEAVDTQIKNYRTGGYSATTKDTAQKTRNNANILTRGANWRKVETPEDRYNEAILKYDPENVKTVKKLTEAEKELEEAQNERYKTNQENIQDLINIVDTFEAYIESGAKLTEEETAIYLQAQRDLLSNRANSMSALDYQSTYITPVLNSNNIVDQQEELFTAIKSGIDTEEALMSEFGSNFVNNIKDQLDLVGLTFEEFIYGMQARAGGPGAYLEELFNVNGIDTNITEVQNALIEFTTNLNLEQAEYAKQINLTAKDIEFLNDNINNTEAIVNYLNKRLQETTIVIKELSEPEKFNLLNQALEQAADSGVITKQTLEEIRDNFNLEDINLFGSNFEDIMAISDALQNFYDQDINIKGLESSLSGETVYQAQEYVNILQQLQEEFNQLTAGQDTVNNKWYQAALELENLSENTQEYEDILNHFSSEEQEIILNIKNQKKIKEQIQEINDKIENIPGYKEAVDIDIQINGGKAVLNEAKALAKGAELLGDNYTIAYDKLGEFQEIFPELIDAERTFTEDGVQLSEKAIKAWQEMYQGKTDAAISNTDAELKLQEVDLEAKLTQVETAIELVQAQQQAETNMRGLSAENANKIYSALIDTYGLMIQDQSTKSEEGTKEQSQDVVDFANSTATTLSASTGTWAEYFNKIAEYANNTYSAMATAAGEAATGEGDGNVNVSNSGATLQPINSNITNTSSYNSQNNNNSKDKQGRLAKTSQKIAERLAKTINDSAGKVLGLAGEEKKFAYLLNDTAGGVALNDNQINEILAGLEARKEAISNKLGEIQNLRNSLNQIKNTVNSAGKDKSGGGGKDSKDKEEELVDILEDQIERYHEVNKQIEYQEQVLKRLQNARDKVYGQKYLDALNKEIDGQQEYIGLLQDRMVLYQAMLQSDREAAAALGATFDENGLITNYTSLTEAKLSDIQAQQKGMTDSEKKEQLDQEYEDFKAVLDQYEETFELMNDATTELEDAFTELNDLIADYVKTQIEAIETVQDKLDTINNIEERFYDNWDKMGERSALYNKQLQQTYDTADQWIAEIGQIEEMYKNGLLTQKAYAEAIGDAEEGLAASINTMFDLQEKMAKIVEETVNEVTARMDQYMAIYEDASKELQFYIDAFTKIYNRSSHAMAAELYNNQADVLQQQIKAEEMYMKTLQENQKQWEEYSDEWFQYEEGIREAKDKIISLTTDTLDALSNAYKEQIQAGIQAFNTAIGVTDFDRLTDNFSKLQEESNRFLDYADKLYETTSLQQKINESINKQDSTAGKARLNNLLDELNALSDKAEVSQYEIDYLQKKYELTLKQNALDEANSQKTLRLMRNDQGDMVYSFVADTEKVTSAKQEYETAMNDLRELSEQYVSETSSNLLQYVKDYEDALLNLDESTFESRQEYEEAVNEIVDYYSKLIYDTKEQLNVGEQNLAQDTYDQIVALRGDSTELTIALAQRESDAILGIKNEENDRILANYDEQSTRAREANEKMVSITQDMRDKLGNSYDEIRGKIEETAADAVTAFETWHDKALIVATTTAETLNPELKDSLQTLKDAEGASDKLSQALVDLVGNNLEGLTDLEGVFTSISSTLGTMFDTINTNQKAFSEMFDNTAIQGYYDTLQRIINTDLQNNWGYQGGWAKDEMALMIEAVASGQYTEKGLEAYLTYHNSLRNQKIAAMTPDLQSKYEKYEGEEALKNLMTYIKGRISKMSTGGYTKEGGLALLHDKELVLNATDTENILAAAMILQGKGEAAAAAGINSGLSRAAASFTGSANNVDQSTNTFYVDFPNATSSSEIEIALTNLMNHADQYKFTS